MSATNATIVQLATSLAAASAEATVLNAENAALKAEIAALKAANASHRHGHQSLADQTKDLLLDTVAQVNTVVPGSMQYRAPRSDSLWDLIFAIKGAMDHAQKVLSSSQAGSSATSVRGRGSDRGSDRGSRGAPRGRYVDRAPATVGTTNSSGSSDQYYQSVGARVYPARGPQTLTQPLTYTQLPTQILDQPQVQASLGTPDLINVQTQRGIVQLAAAESDIAQAAETGDMVAFDQAIDAFRRACSDPSLETSADWVQERIASIESRIPDWAKQCGFTV